MKWLKDGTIPPKNLCIPSGREKNIVPFVAQSIFKVISGEVENDYSSRAT